MKGNIKKIERITCYENKCSKTITLFDKSNRITKLLKYNTKEELYYSEKRVHYENGCLKINSIKIRKNRNLTIKKSVIYGKDGSSFTTLKIYKKDKKTKEDIIHKPSYIKQTEYPDEYTIIDLNYSLEGHLTSLLLKKLDRNQKLIEEYFFEKTNNEDLIWINPLFFLEKHKTIKKYLDKFNFNIYGKRINTELNLSYFQRKRIFNYSNDKLEKKKIFIVCEYDLKNKIFDLFLTEIQIFDQKGNIIEKMDEGCGDGNFSLPTGFKYTNKYDSNDNLLESYSKTSEKTMFTYDKLNNLVKKTTESFSYSELPKIVIDAIYIEKYDHKGNLIEKTGEYLNKETLKYELKSKETNIIKYRK